MTDIHLPGLPCGTGIAEWDRVDAPEMIRRYRAYAAHQKAWADAVLNADDADFQIETYVGVHVQGSRQIIQASQPNPSNKEKELR
jgi:hypothetical protein